MNRSLQGRRILVTRTELNALMLIHMIEARGGVPVFLPFFKLYPAKDQDVLSKVIKTLDQYDMVVFVSPGAVEFGLKEIFLHRAWPIATQVAVVGGSTAKLLKKNGIKQIIMPEDNFSSEGLLAHAALQAEKVNGKRVLIMRADSGRQLLAQTLRERGATVDLVACYERREVDDQALRMSMQNNPVEAVTLFSTEGFHKMQRFIQAGVVRADGKNWSDLPLFTPHQRIAEKARRSGWRHVVFTGMEDVAIVESLCEFDWSGNE